MEESKWMAAEEASEYLGIEEGQLNDLAESGDIPRHNIGETWRFHRDDLDAWVRASRPITDFFTTVEYSIEENTELRDPQREAHAATIEHFACGRDPAILQLPVGCGKSGLIAILPFGLAHGRVLVISPNITIRDSLYADLNIADRRNCFWRKRSVLPPDVMSAGPHVAILDGKGANIHDCENSHIVLTNIQQLASSADRWLPNFSDNTFDLILVDEGHHSAANSWKKVFDRFPNAKIVNLTATPYRADDQEITGKLAYRYSFKRAMVKGYIKRLQAVYVAPSEITFTYEGDTQTHSLNEVLQLKEEEWFSRGVALSAACNEDIVTASLDRLEQLRQTGTRHQIVAVAMQIDHAKAIRSLYIERGYEAETIHSKMSIEDRVEVIRKLKAGLIDVIVQVQMLGEGFDHPPLSVAAIFRPFRSLGPYLQFVGRTMRVVVQNDSRHPDNYGYIVTHAGMNLDTLLTDFRDIEREDQQFLTGLIQGDEPEPPREVIEGRARMKIKSDMVVHDEMVDSLIEEDFLDPDDELVFEELRRNAEMMGLDAEAIIATAKASAHGTTRTVSAPEPFAVNPQRERQEAQRRLNERIKMTARVFLNRAGLAMGGRDISGKLLPHTAGVNFVAALQIFNQQVNKAVNTAPRGDWSLDELKKAEHMLPEILEGEVRRLKAKQRENAENPLSTREKTQ